MEEEKRKERERERQKYEREMMEKQTRRGSLPRSPPPGVKEKPVSREETTGGSGDESESTGDDRRKRVRDVEEVSPRSGLKKSRSVEETNIERGREMDEIDVPRVVEGAMDRLNKWVERNVKNKTVSVVQRDELRGVVDELRGAMTMMRLENARLMGRLEERQEIVKLIRSEVKTVEPGRREGTYAEVVTRAGVERDRAVPGVSGRKGQVKAPNLVIIRKEGKESEEVRKTLKEVVDPRKENLKVKRITKIRNGVAVELLTEGGVERLLKNEVVKAQGLDVRLPQKRRPMIMMYDVGTELKDEELAEEVYYRNFRDKMEFDRFKEGFKVRHRMGGKGENRKSVSRVGSVVIECSAEVRNMIRREERVFVGWNSCRVKDYLDFPRCFRCQKFGHVAKFCVNKVACPICAEEHELKECKAREGDRKCVNCSRDGRIEVEHDARWRECPIFVRFERKYLETIDYGD